MRHRHAEPNKFTSHKNLSLQQTHNIALVEFAETHDHPPGVPDKLLKREPRMTYRSERWGRWGRHRCRWGHYLCERIGNSSLTVSTTRAAFWKPRPTSP